MIAETPRLSPKKKRPKTLIGWREWAGLPDFGIDAINAKIDTGAKTSAIHAFKINEVDRNGIPHVEFYLHPLQRKKYPEIYCCEPIADKRAIRSSNGQIEDRFVIKTHLMLGARNWLIELTLTNRDAMGFRMLIGRDALRRKFVIDPGASYLVSEQKPGEAAL